ncbi:sulfite exporter TauE/SafE-domain-containing protein [Baffinella frigidus]|nr:sulfite exporter TauE/SafE-domain-containing protein [Cryptophyta sp. CCMP2293]
MGGAAVCKWGSSVIFLLLTLDLRAASFLHSAGGAFLPRTFQSSSALRQVHAPPFVLGKKHSVDRPAAPLQGMHMAIDPALATAAVNAGLVLPDPATALGLPVGFMLGLLGGGGSILALPIFLYGLHEPTQSAIAESLVVVSIGAGVGFLAKLKSGVDLKIAAPFAALAMSGSFGTAKFAGAVPEGVRLGMFTVFALTSAVSMWQSTDKTPSPSPEAGPSNLDPEAGPSRKGFGPQLGAQAVGVGVLTSLIGAGGGFVIMPSLTLLGGMPVKRAVGSSLLIICLNSASAFLSYTNEVPMHWNVVVPFAAAVATGSLLGSAFSSSISQDTVKKAFSGMVLATCGGLLASKLPAILATL